MKKAFILAGNFGVGKTSVVNFYSHKPIEKHLTRVHGVISLGGIRGADDLNGMGFHKRRVYEELIPTLNDETLLIHSALYQNIQDVNRLSKTHEPIVIYLDTPFQVNADRMKMRANKTLSPRLYATTVKQLERVRQFCDYRKYKFFHIDNSHELQVVCKEVWNIIETA
jgi:gluconate kinase